MFTDHSEIIIAEDLLGFVFVSEADLFRFVGMRDSISCIQPGMHPYNTLFHERNRSEIIAKIINVKHDREEYPDHDVLHFVKKQKST